MLVQKLEVDDLQSAKGYFDAVMVYAQNKVRQEGVVQFLKIKFESALHCTIPCLTGYIGHLK